MAIPWVTPLDLEIVCKMHLPFNWFKWTQASHNESILCNPKPASLLALAQAILIPPLLDTCVCHTHKTKKKKRKKEKEERKKDWNFVQEATPLSLARWNWQLNGKLMGFWYAQNHSLTA